MPGNQSSVWNKPSTNTFGDQEPLATIAALVRPAPKEFRRIFKPFRLYRAPNLECA